MILSVFFSYIGFSQEDCDYNPYRYEEWKIITEQVYAEIYQEFSVKKCDILQLERLIEDYNTTKDIQYLHTINANYNCSKVIDYAIDLIKTSHEEEARKIAIGMLGFRKHYEAIPLLLNHVKKDISSDEKIVIATTLAILGRKTEALDILNCNCYSMDYMNNTCVYNYFHLFDKITAINYFDYYFNNPQTQVEAASWLARLGICDKTFSVFVKFLKTNTTYQRETEYIFVGLAAIGTEEALELIRKYAKREESLISQSAVNILDRVIRERRLKCKD
jgi:hypothetical protein